MTFPAPLILFFGYSLSGYWSLGKLLAVAGVGAWLSLGGVRRIGAPFAAYLAAITWTTYTSSDLWTSLWGLHGTYTMGLLCALVLIPFWTCPGPEDRPAMERGLRIGVFIFCALGLAQKFIWNPTPAFAEGRAYSTMGAPIYAGALCAFALPFCCRLGWIWIIPMLWATGSRGAWIAAGAGWIFYKWPELSARKRTWGLIASLALLCLAFWIRPLSDLGRAVTWRAALDAFEARPWTGWGAGNFYQVADIFRNPLWHEVYGMTTQDHAHNLFLEAAATSGVFGIVTLCAMLWAMWSRSDRQTRAALLGVFIVGMLNPLPLVVKALCFSFSASCPTEEKKICGPLQTLSSPFALFFFLAVCWLVHLDRLMTFYGNVPWAFSSEKATILSGVVREYKPRWLFKL